MVVFASLHRHWTAPAVAAAVGVRKRSNSALPARSLGKGKELVAEKPARGEADPFAEFKSVLGEDEGFEAPYDPLRQGPLRYVLFDRGSSYGLSRTLTDLHRLARARTDSHGLHGPCTARTDLHGSARTRTDLHGLHGLARIARTCTDPRKMNSLA